MHSSVLTTEPSEIGDLLRGFKFFDICLFYFHEAYILFGISVKNLGVL